MNSKLDTYDEHHKSTENNLFIGSRIDEHPAWTSLSRVPETLIALIPLRKFTVRALLLLSTGQMIFSDSSAEKDVPMKIGQTQLAWGEFEVIDSVMALRITKVA